MLPWTHPPLGFLSQALEAGHSRLQETGKRNRWYAYDSNLSLNSVSNLRFDHNLLIPNSSHTDRFDLQNWLKSKLQCTKCRTQSRLPASYRLDRFLHRPARDLIS
jgi:hypothetical protein